MYGINSKKKVKMLLRSEISDFFHCVWNPLEKSGEMLWLNPSREFGEEVEIISDVNKCHSFIPLKLGAALAWPQDGLWTCLGNLGNQIPWQWVPVRTSYGHQLLSCPRARCAQEWWSPALSTLPGKQTVITCNIPVLDLLCRRSREPTELKVLSFASGVKTAREKKHICNSTNLQQFHSCIWHRVFGTKGEISDPASVDLLHFWSVYSLPDTSAVDFGILHMGLISQ